MSVQNCQNYKKTGEKNCPEIKKCVKMCWIFLQNLEEWLFALQ
jgi:hypothetical protein